MAKRTRGFEIITKYKDKDINLPQRQTSNAAGYDFESAEDITIPSIWKQMFKTFSNIMLGLPYVHNTKPTLIPTGIKSYFKEDEVLCLYNRSSNPFKKGLLLANSVGIVDSDYYNNEDNEGHIQFAFWNLFPFDVEIKKGDRIGQGVFQQFLKADNDNSNGKRKSGFGSTDK